MNATPADNTQHSKPDIDEDLDFQRRVWRFERVGWAVMGLIGLAGLLGLLGPGLLSSAQAGDERLRIEYQRFHRNLAPAALTVHIGEAAVSEGAATLLLDAAFTEEFKIEGIVPRPTQWQFAGDGMRLRFLAADLGSPATVHFYLTPQGYGPAVVAVGLAGATPISLRQFIYP